MKRKTRMGIVTNKMSEEVYNHLEKKAQTNELSQYIIKLVEKDLQDTFLKDQFEMVKGELENMYKTIDKMKHVFQTESDSDNSISDETLVNLNLVSDEEVNSEGFEESVDLDF